MFSLSVATSREIHMLHCLVRAFNTPRLDSPHCPGVRFSTSHLGSYPRPCPLHAGCRKLFQWAVTRQSALYAVRHAHRNPNTQYAPCERYRLVWGGLRTAGSGSVSCTQMNPRFLVLSCRSTSTASPCFMCSGLVVIGRRLRPISQSI